MMGGKPLMNLAAKSAADICRESDLESDVAAPLRANADAAALLEHLLAVGAEKDAVRFLCHALEPREAVWWAWDCAGTIDAASSSAAETAAIAAVGAWLADPRDELRRAAQAAADQCGIERPAGCAALAVFLAEGSLGPPDLGKEVLPPPYSCAKAAAGAILLTAVRQPADASSRARAFVERWFTLAAASPPWAKSAKQPSGTAADGAGAERTA